MTHFELSFKLQHDCPYNELTKRYPNEVMSHWCNKEKDVLEISYHDLDNFQSIQKELEDLAKRAGVEITRKVFTKANVQLVTQHCGCNHLKSVSHVIERHNSLELMPTIYKDGWEWYRVISFSERDVKALFSDLDKFCKVVMISRRTIEDGSMRDTLVVSIANLFGELTEKQSEALVEAIECGYYRVPKRVTTDEVAKRLHLPRTTYGEHLRKAESKVLLAMAPYIHLRQDPKKQRQKRMVTLIQNASL
jgi:predicted DNA binding protein